MPDDPALLDHAETCEDCALLFENEGGLGRVLAMGLPDGEAAPKWVGVGSAVRNDVGLHAWLRSRPTRQRLLMVLIAGLTAILLGGLRPRHDTPGGMSLAAWALSFLFATLLCAGIALASLGRLRSAGRRIAAVTLGLLLPVVYALCQQATHGVDPGEGVTFWHRALSCFGYGTLLVLPLCGLLWALDRDEKPTLSTSVIAGIAAGLSANAALSLHCPQSDAAHLLLGHAAIGALLGLVGAAIAALLARRDERA